MEEAPPTCATSAQSAPNYRSPTTLISDGIRLCSSTFLLQSASGTAGIRFDNYPPNLRLIKQQNVEYMI